jgi:hypothetical protein
LALAALLLCGSLAATAATPARTRPDAAAMEAARRFLCPHGGTPVRGRGGRCRPGSGSGAFGEDPAVRGWDRGLPRAAGTQAPCPAGTHAATAVARPEAVRCIAD